MISERRGNPDRLPCLNWHNANGGCVVRITPDGHNDQRPPIAAPRVTSCAFGGPRLDTLFVTTASNTLGRADLERYPLSGSVFAVAGLATAVPVSTLALRP